MEYYKGEQRVEDNDTIAVILNRIDIKLKCHKRWYNGIHKKQIVF